MLSSERTYREDRAFRSALFLLLCRRRGFLLIVFDASFLYHCAHLEHFDMSDIQMCPRVRREWAMPTFGHCNVKRIGEEERWE
jgi:hypothetical protein